MKKYKHRNRRIWNRFKLVLSMSAIVFSLICLSFAGMFSTYHLIFLIPFIDAERLPRHSEIYIFAMISLIIGVVIAIIFRHIILTPLHNSYSALGKISDGDYDVHVDIKGIRAVRNVARSINKTSEELASIEKMRNEFVDNFSHEFKTPIVSVSGFAKMLRDEKLSSEERREYLDIIISESERLSQLSANVLNLTRLNNQVILKDVTDFNVTEQIRLSVVLLEQKWAEKNITISLNSDEHIISGNEETLRQLWINIIDNAIKYSPENSEISIDIEKNKGKLVFTFTDHGCGMNEETVKHAFERFYQGDMAHKATGNGIGLPVAKRICELHGGSIRIKSTSEAGTVFEVILPIKQAD